MARRKRFKGPGVCAHCRGWCDDLTDDHTPPSSLFPGVPPSELIVVPSCEPCNHGRSNDDEDLRLALTIEHRAHEHAAARTPYATALRALTKPAQRRHAEAVASRIRVVDLVTPAGIYLGKGTVLDVDMRRLEEVAVKITTGIFFEETKRPLAVGHNASAGFAERFIDRDDPEARALYGRVLAHPPRTIGADVFRYHFVRLDEDPDSTVVWMTFFDAMHFVGFTVSEQALEAERKASGSAGVER